MLNKQKRYKNTILRHLNKGKYVGLTILFMVPMTANAATQCVAGEDGSYLPGDGGVNWSCDTVPGTNGQVTLVNNPFYVLARSGLAGPLVVGDADLVVNNADGWGGIGNQYAVGPNGASSGATIEVGNFKVNVTAQYGSILGSQNLVPLTTKNIDVVANYNYTQGGNSSGGVSSYGIITGSTVNSGETWGSGKYTVVTVDNFNLNQRAIGGKVDTISGGLLDTPVLNTGLRSIQGAAYDSGEGSAGKIVINDQLNLTLSGWRIEAIYVSGSGADASGNVATSQVVLNNSNIKLIQEATPAGNKYNYQSSAMKIGKARNIGEGKGEVYSQGVLNIDASEAIGDAIKVYDSGSLLKADYATSVTNILANKTAIAVGPSDWQVAGNVAASDNKVLLKNANLNTVSTTDSLIKVYACPSSNALRQFVF